MRIMTAAALLLTATVHLAASASCFEKDVPLSEVPSRVLTASSNAVDGIVITEAELIGENSGVFYEVGGKVGDIEYEIRVSPSGVVLEIEEDDD